MIIKNHLFPSIDQRVATFGLRQGMTGVDYGCGPGRYTTRFATSIGPTGTVYAIDVYELALAAVR